MGKKWIIALILVGVVSGGMAGKFWSVGAAERPCFGTPAPIAVYRGNIRYLNLLQDSSTIVKVPMGTTTTVQVYRDIAIVEPQDGSVSIVPWDSVMGFITLEKAERIR